MQKDSFNWAIGVGCSVVGYSDVRAARVIDVKEHNGKVVQVVVREDKAKLLNGISSGEPDALKFSPGGFCGHTSGTQRWDIQPDDEGRVHCFTLRCNGNFVKKGENLLSPSVKLSPVHRHYYDFNF